MRKFLIFILFGIFSITASGQMMLPGVVASSVQTFTLNDGLYGHWKFENNAEDSFASFDGTATNITYIAGKSGYAASFNGTSSRIVIGNVIKPTTAISFSIWTKDGGQSTTRHIISNSIYNTAWRGWRFERNNDNSTGMMLFDGSAGSYFDQAYGTNYSNDAWHHTIFTWNGTTVYIYKDGIKSTGYSYSNLISYGTTHNLTFGANDSGGQVYDGEIDEVRIYNRALTDDEAYELYHEFD